MPIASFRIYPDTRNTGKRGYYFTVNIFKTFKELRAKIKQNGSSWSTKGTVGCCQAWRIIRTHGNGKRSYSKEIGEIQLCVKCMGIGVVTHEALHAALRWADYKGIKVETCKNEKLELCTDSEEDVCYALGNMCSQIYNELWKRKLTLHS